MRYNVIGDIHSRSVWRELIREDCVNVFVGDYFSPYFRCDFETQRTEFMDIIMYKVKHPETILLIGNHDEDHWHIHEKYSRFDSNNYSTIKQLFEENKDFFRIAYSIDNKILVTHAGVTSKWFDKYLKNKVTEINPDNIANEINNIWLNGKYTPFNFESNCSYFDYYGDSPQQGPLWVRPQTLYQFNVFKDTEYIQVVGHTQVKFISLGNKENPSGLFLVDALGEAKQSLIIDINGDNISYEINHVKEENEGVCVCD